jgi:hypothetical protein
MPLRVTLARKKKGTVEYIQSRHNNKT